MLKRTNECDVRYQFPCLTVHKQIVCSFMQIYGRIHLVSKVDIRKVRRYQRNNHKQEIEGQKIQLQKKDKWTIKT